MKKIFLLFLLFCQVGFAETKISSLPLLGPTDVTVSDYFPFVNTTSNATSRLKLSDLLTSTAVNAFTPNRYGLVVSGSTTLMNVIAPDSSLTKLLKSGGTSANPSWLAYDNANTASTIVARDASGNFSAGTITASLTGMASGNANLTPNRYGLVVSGSTTLLNVIAPDASTTKVLVSGGTGANPAWNTVTSVFPALTGDVTTSAGSVATTVAKIQGTTVSGVTGTVNSVFSNSPTLVSPALGTPTALVGTNITGTASGLTCGNVTTNANLTGVITSVGNATSIASQTGTGTKFMTSGGTPTVDAGGTLRAPLCETGADAYGNATSAVIHLAQVNQNSETVSKVSNTNASGAGSSVFRATSSVDTVDLKAYSSTNGYSAIESGSGFTNGFKIVQAGAFPVTIGANSSTAMTIKGTNSVAIGPGLISPNATDHFLYITTSNGTPTGTPTTISGSAPIHIDTLANKFYFYSGGAWRTPSAGTPTQTVVTKTTTYTATSSDNLILADTSGGAWTLTIPAASLNSGDLLRVRKITNDFTVLTIGRTGSDTFSDNGSTGNTSSTVNTLGEELTLESDGVSVWHIKRKSPSVWTSYTPTLTAFGTSPTINYAFWKRLGDSLFLQVNITLGTSPAASAARLSLPGTLSFPSTITTVTAVSSFPRSVANSTYYSVNIDPSVASTVVTFGRQDASNAGLTSKNGAALWGDSETVSFTAGPIPINGWKD